MGLSRIVLAILLALAIAPPAAAQQYKVGISPLVVDLGTIESGGQGSGTFYIIATSPDDLLVSLEVSRGTTDFFTRPGYQELLVNYSEEDATPWITFLENPVILRASQGDVRGNRPINFILRIPSNAEPGWHSIQITPTPSTPQSLGSGANLVATVSVTVLFNVPGPSFRQGIILDIARRPSGGQFLDLDIYFQNTGTLTISTGAESSVLDPQGNVLSTTQSSRELVQPGEMVPLRARMEAPGSGEISVRAIASYVTGFATKEGPISIRAAEPGPEPAPSQEAPAPAPILPVAIGIIIVCLALLYYKKH